MTELQNAAPRKRSPYLIWAISFAVLVLLPVLVYFALVRRFTEPNRRPLGPPASPLHPIGSVSVSSAHMGEVMPHRCTGGATTVPPHSPSPYDSPKYKFIYSGYVEGFSWDSEKSQLEPGIALLEYDGALYACDAAGKVIWRTALDGEAQSLAIGPGNSAYVMVFSREANSTTLRSYAANGELLWSTPSHGEIRAVASDGTVYVQQHQGTLHAYTVNGSFAWVSDPTTSDIYGPAIGPDGTLYVTDYHALYALSPRGILLWQQAIDALDQQVHSAPSVAADGTIYFGGSTLFAMRPDGTVKWKFTPPARNAYPEDRATYIFHTPMIAQDGKVYFDMYDGQAYAMTPGGELLWYYQCDKKFCEFGSFEVWRGGVLAGQDFLNSRWLLFTPGISGGLMRNAWPGEFHDHGHSRLAELPAH
jgi:outer membrane protein assembly factor BamB